MNTKIVINGKFLTETLTGIQRYAIEIVSELDKLCENEDIEILVPNSFQPNENTPSLGNIKLVRYGKLGGIKWEQISLPRYLAKQKAIPLNLCNITPLLKPHGYTVIHDISYAENPDFFTTRHSKLSRLWHMLNYYIICKKARHIFTVSEFSKSEIIKRYNVSPERITVAYSSWQHITRTPINDTLLERFPIKNGDYFFSMSSVAKNKNFRWILEAARKNPRQQFVIAGGQNLKKYGEEVKAGDLPNLHFVGYVSDDEARALLGSCKAFLFPTLYEGFGLPPLEAMALGAKAIVSDIPPLREVYGNSVAYIDPLDYSGEVDFDGLLSGISGSEERLERYSWERSAVDMFIKIFKAKDRQDI